MDKTNESINELFDKHLQEMKNDHNISRNDLRTIIETLITIYKNLATNKDNERHRKINTNNSNFLDKVWRHSAAKQLLLSCGWSQTLNDFIVLDDKEINISECLKSLVANRDVRPDSKDWINSEQQFINPSEVRDKELRELAEKERIREMEEYERDRNQRQLIAENVKKEIESDVKFRQLKNQNTNQ